MAGKGNPNTISDKAWRDLRDRAVRHENRNGGSMGDAATARRQAQDPSKARTN